MTKVVSTKTKGNVTTRRYDNGSSCETTAGSGDSRVHRYFNPEGHYLATESVSAGGVAAQTRYASADRSDVAAWPKSHLIRVVTSDASRHLMPVLETVKLNPVTALLIRELVNKRVKSAIALSNHGDHLSAAFKNVFQREGAAKSKDVPSTQSAGAS